MFDVEQFKSKIKEMISVYKQEDQKRLDVASRIDELEWVLLELEFDSRG
jgi:hypothetical protein